MHSNQHRKETCNLTSELDSNQLWPIQREARNCHPGNACTTSEATPEATYHDLNEVVHVMGSNQAENRLLVEHDELASVIHNQAATSLPCHMLA